jgi:2-polyprenyl-3-methyl-5-hydroxy-6-metoxy-1,4-benzoquinol methylase
MDSSAEIRNTRPGERDPSSASFFINEGIHAEEVKNCPFCRKEGARLYGNVRDRIFDVPGLWGFAACPRCQFAWLNPRPCAGEIHKAYARYYTHDVVQEVPSFPSLRRMIKFAILSGTFGYEDLASSPLTRLSGRALRFVPFVREKVLSRIRYLHGSGRGKLLDVGCGNGAFIAHMRGLGWDVLGIEPDAAAARQAREERDVRVLEGSVEGAGLPRGSFDAITLNHVIEHVPDPVETLGQCARLLKPSGKLVVTTPNFLSLAHKVFREAWLHLDPPRHLYLFSPRAMHRALDLAGLNLETCRTISRRVVTWSGSSLIRRNGRWPGMDVGLLPGRLRAEGQAFRLVENVVQLFWRSAGDELLMIASKKA